jgi:hypothetical protein
MATVRREPDGKTGSDLLNVLADFAGHLVPDFQSQRLGLDLPSLLESGGTRSVYECVNNDPCLTGHFPPAADQSLRAFPVSRVLRKRDKCA